MGEIIEQESWRLFRGGFGEYVARATVHQM